MLVGILSPRVQSKLLLLLLECGLLLLQGLKFESMHLQVGLVGLQNVPQIQVKHVQIVVMLFYIYCLGTNIVKVVFQLL